MKPFDKLGEEEVPLDLGNPRFDQSGKVHDWRNYVPEELINDWNNLSLREKQIAWYFAELFASREEWE